jgi:hypothetical protein
MGLAGAVAEDAEAECIRRITETQVVTGRFFSQTVKLQFVVDRWNAG